MVGWNLVIIFKALLPKKAQDDLITRFLHYETT